MNSIVGIMKKVAEKEAGKIYTTELGVVTSIFPRDTELSRDNYQCTVQLKNKKQADGSDFELIKVPVATPHLGMANIPNVGDLVLLSFIGGNINAPVIIGRLHNDEDQPPINKEKEFLIQHSLKGGGSLKIDAAGTIRIFSANEQVEVIVDDNGVTINTSNKPIELKSTTEITINDSGVTINAVNKPIELKSAGEITIGDATTSQVKVGGRLLANAVGDNDDIILSTHTHLGNLGAPCPILIPTEKINSIQAKTRNTQVG